VAELPAGITATWGEARGTHARVMLTVDAQQCIAGLADQHAKAARQLADCLGEFRDQPECCVEHLEAVDQLWAELSSIFWPPD
jgi:hypothetical protein